MSDTLTDKSFIPGYVIRTYEELNFVVSAKVGEDHVEFQIFNIAGFTENGIDPLLAGKNMQSVPVADIKDAAIFLNGSIKWDGCSNWQFQGQERGFIHGCCKADLVRIGTLMGTCWDLASELLPSWSA